MGFLIRRVVHKFHKKMHWSHYLSPRYEAAKPTMGDRVKIRRMKEKQKFDQYLANGVPIFPAHQLPPWRRREAFPIDETKTKEFRCAGIKVRACLPQGNIGFPTHFD